MAPLPPLHERLAKISQERIRNEPNPDDPAEVAFADQRAHEELDRFLSRFEKEPHFQKRLLETFTKRLAGKDEELIDWKKEYLELMAREDHEDSILRPTTTARSMTYADNLLS